MHILFLSDNFPPEGNAPATRLYEHAIRWVKEGHLVTVITCAPNFPEGKLFKGYRNHWRHVEDMDGIKVVRMKTYITANEGFVKRTLDYLSFMFMGFIGGLFEKRPDIIVATSPQFFCALGGLALSIVKRRPFVFELRDLWPASIIAVGAMRRTIFIRLLERIELFMYHHSSAIISVTESFRKDLITRGIPEEKIHVVINGVDLARYSPRPKDQAWANTFGIRARFIAGYIGTHGLAHALPKVLKAAEILRHRTDIAFFFAGSGTQRAMVEQTVASKNLTNVCLIPRQPKEMMPILWSLCDIAIVPLRNAPIFETVIPSKIFESMGMGVPILISLPAGEATEIIRTTGAGISVPPEDPIAMASAIEALADDPIRLATLRDRAYAAAPSYSRETQAALMLTILRKCLSQPSLMESP